MASKSPLDQILSDMPETQAAPIEVQKAITRSNQAVAKAQKLVQENAAQLRAEEKVSISLAPMYRPYFGDVMSVFLNGLPIYLPIDGRSYQIPKSYAMIVQERRRRVDEHVMRSQRLADVQSNFERSAGELVLIPR